MFKEWFGGKRRCAERGTPANPACAEVREAIMVAMFAEASGVEAFVSAHLETCGPCRAWEAEIRRMHRGCRESDVLEDVSRLTSSALRCCEAAAPSAEEGLSAPRREAERSSDRGVLLVVVLAAVLFNLMLVLALEGASRIVVPAAGVVLMLSCAVWVHGDATRRKMPAAFWTAVQPFTVPIGLVAYLACRKRASIRCPSCGRTVPARDRFCPECGSGLVAFCCGCGRSVKKEFRVCPFCGTRLEECFPREGEAGGTCGWSRAQVGFVAGANALLLAGLAAAMIWGGARSSLVAAFLYLLGYLPIFNWVSIDSRRRAMATIPWGILVLVTLYAGLIIYLACRKDVRTACPVCGSHPPVSFNFCPCCGSVLGESCPSCGAASRGSRFCAFCGAQILSAGASPRSPE